MMGPDVTQVALKTMAEPRPDARGYVRHRASAGGCHRHDANRANPVMRAGHAAVENVTRPAR
jgi:hypothetical protein